MSEWGREYQAIAMEGRTLPVPCGFCGDPVPDLHGRHGDEMSGVVHHIDEDRMNNDPSNLMVAHNTCHVRHHMTGKVFTDEHLAHLSASKKGRPHSEAQRQALADAWADEERVKAASLRVAASNRTRAVCSDCGKEWGGVWRTRHVKEGKCIPVEDQPNG